MKWERGLFDIALRHGIYADGRTTVPLEGFLNEERTFALFLRGGFIEVTHIPSGQRIATTSSLASADRIVVQLHDMAIDWTKADLAFTEVEYVTIHAVLQQT